VIQAAPDAPARAPAAVPAAAGHAPAERRPSSRALVGAAVLVGLGTLLRLGTTSPLWLDEALSANIAALPVGDMLDALRRDGHPPLFYLLASVWTGAFGDGDVAVRSLSAVFGIATLPLVWAAGRRLGGPTCALAATVLYATSPFAIRYATEARMYALVAFLVVAGWLALPPGRGAAHPRPPRPRVPPLGPAAADPLLEPVPPGGGGQRPAGAHVARPPAGGAGRHPAAVGRRARRRWAALPPVAAGVPDPGGHDRHPVGRAHPALRRCSSSA
jgi:hypothetical protein